MTQLAGLGQIDRPTMDRARHFEHAAVESIMDRCLDPIYHMCFALTGDAEQAESLTQHALMRGLDTLGGARGDEADLLALLLRGAAREAALRQPSQPGLRRSIAQLTTTEYELVALRVLAGLSTERLAPSLSSRQTVLRAQLLNALRLLAGERGNLAPLPWKGQDLTEFDAAVDRVVAGEAPEQAATAVAEPTDVLARLRTVMDLRRVPTEPLEPPSRDRLYHEVLTATQERRVHWVQGHQGSPKVPGIQQRRRRRPARGVVTLGVSVMLAALVGTTLAVVSSFADPDSLLYPLKRLGESVLVSATPSAVGRADLEIKLAQTREREAEDMASRGKGNLAVQAVRDRVSLLQAAARELSGASPKNTRWKNTRNSLLNAATAPLDEVERDLQLAGQPSAAEEVRQIDVDWVHQEPSLRQSLSQPAPSPSAPSPTGA